MNLHLELADKNWGISFEKKKFREKIQIYSANFEYIATNFKYTALKFKYLTPNSK